mmetsp:Transcript_33611/g.106239  ORF Transcript_33611/g.106239 Transcript_33611/m.106239 type:complete len:215 (-) Transcript_33611:387-1031(-)
MASMCNSRSGGVAATIFIGLMLSLCHAVAAASTAASSSKAPPSAGGSASAAARLCTMASFAERFPSSSVDARKRTELGAQPQLPSASSAASGLGVSRTLGWGSQAQCRAWSTPSGMTTTWPQPSGLSCRPRVGLRWPLASIAVRGLGLCDPRNLTPKRLSAEPGATTTAVLAALTMSSLSRWQSPPCAAATAGAWQGASSVTALGPRLGASVVG